MSFFAACGDVRYARIIGDDDDTPRFELHLNSLFDLFTQHVLPERFFILFHLCFFSRYAFIEFNEASCVARALQYNGAIFGGEPLK